MKFYRIFLIGLSVYILAYFAPVSTKNILGIFGGFYLTALDFAMTFSIFSMDIDGTKGGLIVIDLIAGVIANLLGLYAIINGLLGNFSRCLKSMVIVIIMWGVCFITYAVDMGMPAFRGVPIAHIFWGAGMILIMIAVRRLRKDDQFLKFNLFKKDNLKRIFQPDSIGAPNP